MSIQSRHLPSWKGKPGVTPPVAGRRFHLVKGADRQPVARPNKCPPQSEKQGEEDGTTTAIPEAVAVEETDPGSAPAGLLIVGVAAMATIVTLVFNRRSSG